MKTHLKDVLGYKPVELADAMLRLRLDTPPKEGLQLDELSGTEILSRLQNFDPRPMLPSVAQRLHDYTSHINEHFHHPSGDPNKSFSEQLLIDPNNPPPDLQARDFRDVTFHNDVGLFYDALQNVLMGQPLTMVQRMALGDFSRICNGMQHNLDIEIEALKATNRLAQSNPDAEYATEEAINTRGENIMAALNAKAHIDQYLQPMCGALCRQLGIQELRPDEPNTGRA